MNGNLSIITKDLSDINHIFLFKIIPDLGMIPLMY
jgi:hypothetical protein